MWKKLGRVERCLLPLLLCLVASACSPVGVTQFKNASVAPSAQSAPSPTTIAQASPTSAIASLQSQSQIAGFSQDGKHYIYLESWRDTGAGVPHAALQVTNVAASGCVTNGCVQTQFRETDAGLSMEAAANSLLQQTQKLRQDLGLAAPIAGVSLPITSRSRTPDGTEIVIAQLNNQPLQLQLQQRKITTAEGAAETEQAAMQLVANYGGRQRSIGSLNQMQSGTMNFSIRDVQRSPNGKGVVVLITATKRVYEGTMGRILVQSFEL